MLAGLCSKTIVLPFDLVKKRLQVISLVYYILYKNNVCAMYTNYTENEIPLHCPFNVYPKSYKMLLIIYILLEEWYMIISMWLLCNIINITAVFDWTNIWWHAVYSIIVYIHTVYIKSFEGENFHGFCGLLLTTNVLPLKIFLEYQHHPLTTQSMVPPGLKFSTTKVFPTY